LIDKEVAEDAKESEDVLKQTNSPNIFGYLANEDVDDDAVKLENTEEDPSIDPELELNLDPSSELRNLFEAGGE